MSAQHFALKPDAEFLSRVHFAFYNIVGIRASGLTPCCADKASLSLLLLLLLLLLLPLLLPLLLLLCSVSPYREGLQRH
jgi:hypothetical protein